MTRALVATYITAAVFARDVWNALRWVAAGAVETWRATRTAVAA